MDIQTKICSSCRQELPLSSFSIDRSKKDNLRSSCKACKKTYDKEYIKKNNEVIKAKRTEYTKKNANRKAEYDKKRREEKREEINESKRKYYHERGKEVGIEPLSTGGEHSIDNLTIACPTCNLSKNNKSMIIWMIQNRVRGGSFNAE